MKLSGLLVLFLLTLSLTGGFIQAQQPPAGGEVAGTPWVGGMGITETVSEIMARGQGLPPGGKLLFGEEHELRVMPGRRSHPQNPGAAAISQWPPSKNRRMESVETLAPMNPQAIGVDFLGTQISETPGYVPPDCDGAVGPSQFLVCVNGRIRTFTKSGVTDGAIDAFTDTFFSSVLDGSSASDPHVVYDRLSQRWFIVMINVNTPDRVMIAVSSGPTITSISSFTFYEFQHDSVGTIPNGDTGGFADYPTLGVDNNALYIGVNVFNAAGTAYIGSTAFVVRKSSVTGGGPIVVTAFRDIATGSVSGPYSPEGASNDDASATEGYFVGADTRFFGLVQVRRVSNPGGTPAMSGNLSITVPATYFPSTVPAKGSTPLGLDAVDDRLSTAILKNGTIWVSQAIAVNSSGVADTSGTARDGVRFYEINNLSTTPALNQSGTLYSSASTNPKYFWNPSIAMSGQGHVAIGCSYAGAADFAGVAYAGRFSTDPSGTVQSATQFAGSSSYNIQTNPADGFQRWGDFSTTSLDPNDNMTIWTVQEYCNATNSWAVRVTQLKAPPPVTPSSASPATITKGSSSIDVVVSGTSTGGSGFYDPGPGYPNRFAAAVSGGGVTVNSVTVTDPTHITLNLSVSAGAPAGGRTLTVTNPDAQAVTSASGILMVSISNCPAVTVSPPVLPDGAAGQSYSQALTASGGTTPYIFMTTAGTLPAGLSLSPAGVLSGIPSFGGSYNFTVTATDSNGCQGSRPYTLTVTGCPQIILSPTALPNGGVDLGYNQTITASGGKSPYTFSVTSGALPNGLSLSGAGGLTGTPLTAGTSNFTVTATDSNFCPGSQNYSLTIDPFNLNSINLTALGSAYTQNFNTLASSGSSSTLPTGWMLSESGSNANTAYTAGDGSANNGDTYSFGSTGSSDRALGGIQSNSLNPTFGASVTNNTGATLSSLLITYAGEQWRLGGTGRSDRIDFQLSTDATSLTSGTFTDYNAFDFLSPTTTGPTGALDGNASANRTSITGTITGLSITGGSTFFIRWTDLNVNGSDDGLAVDDFSITPLGPTNPAGTGASNPSIVNPGGQALLTVTVTPGANPPSTGIGVTGDLTFIGGPASQAFFDDGTHGDVAGGDNVFSFGTNVAIGTTPGLKNLPVVITDAQSRTGNASISLTVPCPAISLTLPPLPDGKIGVQYGDTLTASGGSSPYTFAVSSGNPPTGVTLSPSGVLAGTPTSANTFVFAVSATDVHNCTGTQSYSVQIAPDSNVSLTINLNPHWNLISNPVVAADDSVEHLFPGAVSNAFLYNGANGYQVSNRIQNSVGYWLKFNSAALVKVNGVLRLLDSIDVSAGWNLIGSLSRSIPASSLRSIGTTIMSRVFGYSTSYETVDSLRPGAGYWIKCDLPGKIVLAGSGPTFAMTSARDISDDLSSMNKLTVTDAGGASQTLYFGEQGKLSVSPGRYVLPPVPPAGTFDLRFTSQRSLETFSDNAQSPGLNISVQSSAYPLTVRWEFAKENNLRYDLLSSDGNRRFATGLVQPSGSMKISDTQSIPLLLKVHDESRVPLKVTLMANYPNPFNPKTVIRFQLSTSSLVSLMVYNTVGERVATLLDRQAQDGGEHQAEFSAENLPSGIYLYELVAEQSDGNSATSNTFRQVKKMALIR